MNKIAHNMSLTTGYIPVLAPKQKVALLLGTIGLFLIVLAGFNLEFPNRGLWLITSLSMITLGISWYAYETYKNLPEGIKNNGIWFKSLSNRGIVGWIVAILLTGFYVVLYFYPYYLGLRDQADNTGIIALFDPLSQLLSGRPASQWFVYGTLYTVAIFAFGIKFILKYRHNRYEVIRTISVMFFQTAFAFLIPEIMARLNSNIPYTDLKNLWPLAYYNFEEYRVEGYLNSGTIGIALLLFGIIATFVITPILTYKYGKRWYCSWVCGCGGLAETAGDPFRQLSSKKVSAWKIERWLIHTVLVFVTLMTTAVVYSYLGEDTSKYLLTKSTFLISVALVLTIVFALIWIFKRNELKKDARYGAIGFFVFVIGLIVLHFSTKGTLFFIEAGTLKKVYGFLIGAIFSGVIGVGFYPLLGNRVWCRFGCPMAAMMGIQQRLFSKFRITTNGGQCISCGNCSTYCEMGIDVRAYAQKGENIVRASCVGCGVCSAVCPRGVLKLENGPLENRINPTDILLGNDVDLLKHI
jgi:polyferredoxin